MWENVAVKGLVEMTAGCKWMLRFLVKRRLYFCLNI